jgi:signal peptidase II
MRSFKSHAPLIGLGIVAVDQGSKLLARAFVPLCDAAACETHRILGPIGFLRVENRGSALGFVQGLALWTSLALVALALVPIIGKRLSTPATRRGVWLLLGGALANAFDRVAWGGVTDFLDPGGVVVFNLADVALLIGCVLSTAALIGASRAKSSSPTSVGRFGPRRANQGVWEGGDE